MSAQGSDYTDKSDESGRPKPSADATPEPAGACRQLRSAQLFGSAREVVIQHDRHVYRLRMTNRGGLILTK